MASGAMFGKYTGVLKEDYGSRIVFLAEDYSSPSEYGVFCLFTSTGKAEFIPKHEIQIKEQSKYTNFKRDKGVVYDNRSGKCSNRVS